MRHAAPRLIPRKQGKMPIDASKPIRLATIEQRLCLLDESVRPLGYLHQPGLTIRTPYVRDGGRYHRNARCKKLRSFRRADEAGRLVQRERHYPDPPSGEVAGQIRIRFAT